jgi:hypothetical protein
MCSIQSYIQTNIHRFATDSKTLNSLKTESKGEKPRRSVKPHRHGIRKTKVPSGQRLTRAKYLDKET